MEMKSPLIGFCFLLLTACTTTGAPNSLSSSEVSSIHTVMIDNNVNVPAEISYESRSRTMGLMVGGVIGYGAMCAAETNENQKLEAVFQRSNDSLGNTIQRDFAQALSTNPHFVLENTGKTDAMFRLSVGDFGLMSEDIASQTVVPYLTADAQLVNAAGKTVWEDKQKAVLDDGAYAHYTLQDYLQKPTLLKTAYNTLLEQVTDNWGENLQG